MRRILPIFLFFLGGSSYGVDMEKSAAMDSGNNVGVGVAFSGLTGISMYAETDRSNFIQGAIGFEPYGSYEATGDYAFTHRNAFSANPNVTPYWGIGGIVLHDRNDYWTRYQREGYDSTTYFGARIALGVNFVIPRTPVQLGAEVAPSLLLTPATYSYLQGRLSARVLF
ncbi:MAG: hypothetical protein WCI18_13470 [Pseudomonadota bacterium]